MSQVNFHIIEGDIKDYWGKYEEFIRLYNSNKLSVKQIKEKLNLTHAEYRRFRKHAFKEDRLTFDKKLRKPLKKKQVPDVTPKNYHQAGKKFYVVKYIDNKRIGYGSYSSEEIAKQIVSKLRACNWDKTELPRIQKEVMNHG